VWDLRDEAVALLRVHPTGPVHNELNDALRLCPQAQTSPGAPRPGANAQRPLVRLERHGLSSNAAVLTNGPGAEDPSGDLGQPGETSNARQ
jgi:hypothetical protein